MSIVDAPTTRSKKASSQIVQQRQVGPWVLTNLIGQGATTEVFAAHHVDCEPESASYAVKVLADEFRRDPNAIQAIQREAFVLSQVKHPNLASLLDSRIDAPPFWVATPRLAGAPANSQAKPRLDLPQALWYARQAAGALSALHARKWLHGDVKPDNIIIAPSGHLTVIDLGFAMNHDEPLPQVWRGSPEYAAPESLRPATKTGSASDVYSLGVVLYQWLVGSTPFSGNSAAELAEAHANRPMPDPRQQRPTLNKGVVELLRAMLAKEPLRRPLIDEVSERLGELEIETFDLRTFA